MHIAIMIGIFGIRLVSEIVMTFAFSVVSVVVVCGDLLGFAVVVGVLNFNIVHLGRTVLVTMRTFAVAFVGFITNVGIVCMVFGLNGAVEVFTTDFGVVDVTLIHLNVLNGTLVGMVLVGVTVVYEVVEFLVTKLLNVVGVGVVDFVVVELEFKIEILIVVNVTFNRFAGSATIFGVVVFLELIVEIEVLIVVGVTMVLGVVTNTVEFCVPLPFPSVSINGVVVVSSDALLSDDSSLCGVVVKSISVDSSTKYVEKS